MHVMRVLDGVPDVAFVRFSDADVVRHKLVQRIVSAYAEHAEQTRRGRPRMTVHVEVENRTGQAVDERRPVPRSVATLRAEGVTAGEVGVVARRARAEMAALNAAHRGKDEPTDVLSFPLDGRDALPYGLPRQLGDVVVCPERAEARRDADRAPPRARRAAPRGIRPRGR